MTITISELRRADVTTYQQLAVLVKQAEPRQHPPESYRLQVDIARPYSAAYAASNIPSDGPTLPFLLMETAAEIAAAKKEEKNTEKLIDWLHNTSKLYL